MVRPMRNDEQFSVPWDPPPISEILDKLRKTFADSYRESWLRLVMLGIAGYTKNPGDAATQSDRDGRTTLCGHTNVGDGAGNSRMSMGKRLSAYT